jgi:hypothetical protein
MLQQSCKQPERTLKAKSETEEICEKESIDVSSATELFDLSHISMLSSLLCALVMRLRIGLADRTGAPPQGDRGWEVTPLPRRHAVCVGSRTRPPKRS